MQPQRKRLSVNRRMPHILLACFLSSAVALGTFRAAFAHPLGNFTINRYSKLEVGAKAGGTLYCRYGRNSAHAERSLIDTDADGLLSRRELELYRSAKGVDLAKGLALTVDGIPVQLQPQSNALYFPSGQAGLPTLRFELQLQATARTKAASFITPMVTMPTAWAGRKLLRSPVQAPQSSILPCRRRTAVKG